MSYFRSLDGHRYINLTTYRKNGMPVTTPVWFAQASDRLYAYSVANAGKIKRIRANPSVHLAPCTVRGRPVGARLAARARILSADEGAVAEELLNRKYGWQKRLLNLVRRLRPQPRNYIEILPPKD